MKKILSTIAVGVIAVLALTGCLDDGKPTSEPAAEESAQAERSLDQFLKAQPAQQFTWSQLRQNLIEIQAAQANTTATTSFMFNVGVADPIDSCPSIGFAIPSTYQLTNPQQAIEVGVYGDPNPAVTIDQMENTGVYSGDSSATYVICVTEDGTGYPVYHEGFVYTVAGPATWDPDEKRVVRTGAPSVEVTTEK